MAANLYNMVARQEAISTLPSKCMPLSPLPAKEGRSNLSLHSGRAGQWESRSFRQLLYGIQRLPILALPCSLAIANQIAIAESHKPQPAPVPFPIPGHPGANICRGLAKPASKLRPCAATKRCIAADSTRPIVGLTGLSQLLACCRELDHAAQD
jgi:hypothetical protein